MRFVHSSRPPAFQDPELTMFSAQVKIVQGTERDHCCCLIANLQVANQFWIWLETMK